MPNEKTYALVMSDAQAEVVARILSWHMIDTVQDLDAEAVTDLYVQLAAQRRVGISATEPGTVPLSEAERMALAVLMFHRGGDWTDGARAEWLALTGYDECTTVTLCNVAR